MARSYETDLLLACAKLGRCFVMRSFRHFLISSHRQRVIAWKNVFHSKNICAFQKRAVKIQQQKQKEALHLEQERERELEKERQLTAKLAKKTDS